MADLVLAVDLGTSGAKVAVVSADGDVVAHGFEPTSLILTDDGGVEQDPEQWWRAISAATRRMLAESDVDPTRIVAACMSAQWGGTVAVGRDGRHLHNALIWMDGRGEPHAKRLLGGGVEVPGTGYNARKLAHWVRTAGGPPSLSGKDPVGQVQWFKHNRPDVYRATAYFLDVPEYLTMRMTGRAVATYDSIAIRWCTDNRDARRVRYDPRLLRQGDLDRARLPELVPPATVVGRVLPEVARELGIPDTVQIVGGVGDTVATAVGAGAVRDYEPHLYVGTSAWLSCHTPVKRTDARHAIASLPSVVPGQYWIANVQETAGKALSWMADNVVWAADGLIDQPMPDDRMERLNALAEKAAPGSDGVLFLPWLNGERTPAEDDNLRGAWFNLSLHTERADLARSVFEGVALNTRWMLDAVERFVSRELPSGLDDIRFVGGGARSTLLCQTMADVLDRRVHQMADPVQANARGAGFIALAALGRLRWQDVPDLVRVGTTYTPIAAHRPLFDRMYATFRGFHKATKSVYAQHNQNPREAA